MAIYKNYTIHKARELATTLKRGGVSEQVIKAVKEFDGSYKGAMQLCGKLVFWADASTFDDYWQEQVQKGLQEETGNACSLMRKLAKEVE